MTSRRRPAALLLAACAAAGCAFDRSPDAGASDTGPVTVQLLAINDFHGYLDPPDGADGDRGGAAWVVGLADALRAEHRHTVVVGAGDMVGASPLVSGLFHDEPTIAFLDRLGLRYTAVGNHEFDAGTQALRRLQNGGCAVVSEDAARQSCALGPYDGAGFGYLSANVVERDSGMPLFPPFAVETVRLDGGGDLRIAFVGLVLAETPSLVTAEAVADVRFKPVAETANALLPALRAADPDAIVLLLHEGGAVPDGQGADGDCPDLGGALVPVLDALDPAYDIIVSGHTHEVYVCERDGRLITSAGEYGRWLTRIRLRFDPASGALAGRSARNIAVAHEGGAVSYRPDPAIAAMVDAYRKRAAPIMDRPVGRITADLTLQSDAGGMTAIGAVVADARLAAMADHDPDFAVVNIGGVRASLLAGGTGVVSHGDLLRVQPFGDELLLVTLSGAQVRALLAQQWREDGAPELLQVSRGLSYAWQANDVGRGAVVPGSVRVAGRPLDDDATYRVVISSYLAGGGDGFGVLTDAPLMARGPGDVPALGAYFAAHSPLSPPSGARVRRQR